MKRARRLYYITLNCFQITTFYENKKIIEERAETLLFCVDYTRSAKGDDGNVCRNFQFQFLFPFFFLPLPSFDFDTRGIPTSLATNTS